MAQLLAADERVASTATRHLIHRPMSAEHFLLGAPTWQEERFALAGDMPGDHPLFNDGLGQVHDTQLFVEIAGQVGAFVGRRCFRVPLNRLCRFSRLEFTLTAPAAWRVGEQRSHLTMDIQATPAGPLHGIPEGLRLRAEMEIDGVTACLGVADLRFAAPVHHRYRRAVGRGLAYGPTPAEPVTVGRFDPRNVVVSAPIDAGAGLVTELVVDTEHPGFFREHDGFVPDMLLVEAIRQTSILMATRTHGFSALHTSVVAATVQFRADAILNAPLTCTAVGDATQARLRTKIEQLDRVIAEAEVALAHAI